MKEKGGRFFDYVSEALYGFVVKAATSDDIEPGHGKSYEREQNNNRWVESIYKGVFSRMFFVPLSEVFCQAHEHHNIKR